MKINILYQITSLFAYIFPFTEKQHVKILEQTKTHANSHGFYTTIDLILVSSIVLQVRY